MLAEILIIAFVPALLAAAGIWDLASFTIPNFLSVALIGLFAVFAFAAGLTLPAVGLHLLAGLTGLVLGFGLFALGWIGGGDAKLFAAVTLWLGFHDLMNYALLASVFGGVLTLALLALRRWQLPAPLVRQAWALRLHDARSGIPYGVALAIGALVLLPGTEVFRLAIAA